jgi:exopolysaccharide biosynthesis polyprenyl glycosylphosphotransferase
VAQRRDALLTAALAIGDLVAVAAAYWIARDPGLHRWAVRHVALGEGAEPAIYITVPIWMAVLFACGLYERRRRIVVELRRVVEAVSLSMLAVVVLVLAGGIDAGEGWIAPAWAISLPMLIVWRLAASRVLRALQAHGFVGVRAIVVGSDEDSKALVRTLTRQRWRGYEVAGYVDIRGDQASASADDSPVWHSAERITDAVLHTDSGAVIVAASAMGEQTLPAVHHAVEPLGVEVLMSPVLPGLAASRIAVTPVDGLAMLALRRRRLRQSEAAAKRAIDIAGSASLLLLAAPLMAVIAVAIALGSPGPILFRQVRTGRDGHPFRMYKFRSMIIDAEERLDEIRAANEADGVLFKMQDDPRVHRVGGFLRRFSLDELPQLINVLRGDMSLVGPRPALPDEANRWDARWRARLLVKPGLTGLWQVNGRHDLAFDDYIRYDLFYVANWSLALDLLVLLRTLPALLTRRGAY